MRFWVPAASAALVGALGVSVTALMPMAEARSPAPAFSSASASSASIVGTVLPWDPVATLSKPTPTSATPTSRSPAAVPQDSTRVAPGLGFTWPLSPRPEVLRRFEQPRSQWSAGHRGVDLLAAVGQPVLSAGAGLVAFSGVIAGRGVITVRHSGGLRTTYEPVDQRLKSGALVRRGARIGVVSPTPGHCRPRTCLHWGAITASTYRDPLSLLGLSRPILLPLG